MCLQQLLRCAASLTTQCLQSFIAPLVTLILHHQCVTTRCGKRFLFGNTPGSRQSGVFQFCQQFVLLNPTAAMDLQRLDAARFCGRDVDHAAGFCKRLCAAHPAGGLAGRCGQRRGRHEDCSEQQTQPAETLQ